VATIHRLDWATEKWGALARKCLQLGERVAARLPHETIVVSKGLRQYVKEKHGRETHHISHGIELPEVVTPDVITQKYGLKGNDYILFMGRLSPEKRVDWVIQAFKNIRIPAVYSRGVKLVIAGGTSATDDYVSRLHQDGSGNDRILFTGYVTGKEKAELLSNALVFVMPSSLEGYPIALLEGKSYGRCCLVSDILPHQEALEDGNDGRMFDQHNFEAFSAALQDLLNHPETIREIGAKARRFMEGQPGWVDVARETEHVYSKLNKP
jgi:glycosyltransferase involved in cell wall biosynthesis